MLLRRPHPSKCWICDSSIQSSHEHKFKASDLRRHFGEGKLVVFPEGDYELRNLAQGLNSKFLKYSSTICQPCNSSTTQESDKAYDKLINYIEQNGADEVAVSNAFQNADFVKGSKYYIPLFRYFAKLIGCHLADIGAPIPAHLSRFVAKNNTKNCIWLDIRRDPEYQRISSEHSITDLKYAAHGGLVVITKEPNFLPVRIHTSLTIGRIQFVFFYVYTIFEIWEMRLLFPQFVEWCASTALAAKENPITDPKLKKLGLK